MKSSTRVFVGIIFLLASLIFMNPASKAKAAYASKGQMISTSEYIAIVNVGKVDKVEKQGFNWTYSQRADVTLEKALKGEPPNKFQIYGGENFICARVGLEPGRYLVFLNHSRDLLIGSNWHLSVRPIKDGKIEWFDGESFSPLKLAPEDKVIAEINKQLSDRKEFDNLPADLRQLATASVLEDAVIGEAPGPSETQKHFKELQKDPPKLADLELAFKYGTPAGRVYAAILMYGRDPDKGKSALAQLGICNSTVEYKSGCRMTVAGMWAVASDLYATGKYLNLALTSK
jgi:hypothetical protein